MIQSAYCIARTLTTSLLPWIMLKAPLLGEIWSLKVKWQLNESWQQERANSLEQPLFNVNVLAM
jgi:hypothetical protein